MRGMEFGTIPKNTFPDDSGSSNLAFIGGTLGPTLRPDFIVVERRVWMGKGG